MDNFYRFINSVKSNPDLYPITIIQLVDRHLSDIDNKKHLFYFDEDEAAMSIDLFSLFKEGKRSDRSFDLEDFQAFFIGSVDGWRKRTTNERRFSESFLYVPKKNGKTTLAGGFSTKSFAFDGFEGAEVYFAATTRSQASKTFVNARAIMKNLKIDYPENFQDIDISKYAVINDSTNSVMQAVSKEADNVEGGNTTWGVCDEIHLYKHWELIDNLKSGMNQDGAHLMMTSTAGTNPYSICEDYVQYCKQVLAGIVEDDYIFPMLYLPDERDEITLPDGSKDYDWKNPRLWYKVNPGAGTIKNMDLIEKEFTQAVNRGGEKESDFKTKQLNITVRSKSTWIKNDIWLAQGTNWNYDNFKYNDIYFGLDLSKVRDITALIGVIPYETKNNKGKKATGFKILRRFYCPESKINEEHRLDGVNYRKWHREGHIIATPGDVVDYGYIKNDLKKLALDFKIPLLNYDRKYHIDIIVDLIDEGFECNPFGQTTTDMNGPVMMIESLTYDGLLDHGNDPVLAWMMDNVILFKDSNGNRKIDRKESRDKVDGPVALAMALAAYLQEKPRAPREMTKADIEALVIDLSEEE